MNIKDYFAFTRGEKRGTVVLLLIITVLIVANLSVNLFKQQHHQPDFSEFEAAINEFEYEIETRKNTSNKKTLTIELFEFNPNTISDEEWLRLGFTDWQVKTINNYKAKGGNWKTKNDVAKIYHLEETHFQQLKSFILLPDEIEQKKKSYPKEKLVEIDYFEFDPNTISKEKWKQLGFKDWQIKTIFNYKAKGGSWRFKADVKKIYGLANADYLKLAPYILLPEKKVKKKYTTNKKPARPSSEDFTLKVDINTANAKELTNLKGIYSEKYAAIIVKHRDKLGGFTTKEQLKEVWNMTEETYNGLISQVLIGRYTPKKININTSSVKQLQSHPYIGWKTANAIFKYRKANGNYQKIEEVKKIHLINKKTYLKIAPYLTIE